MPNRKNTKWKRPKGYLHLTNKLPEGRLRQQLLQRIENPQVVAQHAFYPLLYEPITFRRYKKITDEAGNRIGNAHTTRKNGKVKPNRKVRPIHYATHLDALIYGYYANERLLPLYETELAKTQGLSECITAYRFLPQPDDPEKGKNNIFFAKEVFDEIRQRETCSVVCMDISSFFSSLDHGYLKSCWAQLLGEPQLPDDHYNVFKSVSRFRYINRNELRQYATRNGRKAPFDERRLAAIRKEGVEAFFASPEDFREQLQAGKFRVLKNHWKREEGNRKVGIGIPQGLAISPLLANLYLLEFDRWVVTELAQQYPLFYRRYSDDIAVVVPTASMQVVKAALGKKMEDYHLKISDEKTEVFHFRPYALPNGSQRLQVWREDLEGRQHVDQPFNYLGFSFYGYQTLLKSANVSAFYREMIEAIKTKGRRIRNAQQRTLSDRVPVHNGKLKRLFTDSGLQGRFWPVNRQTLQFDPITQTHRFAPSPRQLFRRHRGNFLRYAQRAAEIMEEPAIWRQLKKRKRIFKEAKRKHWPENK